MAQYDPALKREIRLFFRRTVAGIFGQRLDVLQPCKFRYVSYDGQVDYDMEPVSMDELSREGDFANESSNTLPLIERVDVLDRPTETHGIY